MQQPLPGLEHLAPKHMKECEECGIPFARMSVATGGKRNISRRQWEALRFCSIECANKDRERRYNPMKDLDVVHEHGRRISEGVRKQSWWRENRARKAAERIYQEQRRVQRQRESRLQGMIDDLDRLKRRLERPCSCQICQGERRRRDKLARERRRRRENPEAVRTERKRWKAAWRAAHPEAVRANNRKWKALKRGAEGHSTGQQDQWRLEYYGGQCAYCRTDLEALDVAWHWDHVIPLSKGGSNWPANLRPACPTCNTAKSDQDWRSWLKTTPYAGSEN